MKKRGFTLIELLAVIVILAIISLIAVPVILNIIRDAKKSSAKDSAYGYIKAVENYQAMEMLKGNIGLKEGKYNTVSETTIGETKYKKLNDIVSLKGDKPTGGTVTILKNQAVGSAYLCINSYVVEYLNNEANIVSDDCGEMGSIIEFVVDSEDYQINRTLTINYPKGNYEYYYKVSGKAKLNDTYIEKDKEIKTENNVSILLEENQTVEVWMIKNGKKISIRNYVEEKIDNVEIAQISIKDTTASYPTLTNMGIEYSSNIELEYENQEGTSAYYSVDDGITWEKYTKSVTKNVSSGKIKAKMVRDKSKREGNIVEKEISLASDAIGPAAYDGDVNTYYTLSSDNTYYMLVDSTMIGKTISLSYVGIPTAYASKTSEFQWVNSDGEVINTFSSVSLSKNGAASVSKSGEFVIPEGTTKLQVKCLSTINIKELQIKSIPIINVKQYYSKITEYGVEDAYNEVTISYFATSVQKLYKIGDGEWQKYQDKGIRLELGKTIYTKGIDKNGIETETASYTSVLSTDTIGKAAYDGDINTYYTLSSGNTYYMDVDSAMIGKTISLSYVGIPTAYGSKTSEFQWINSSNEVINTFSSISLDKNGASSASKSGEFVIPEGTTKLQVKCLSTINIKEIQVKTIPVINVKQYYSRITENGVNDAYNVATVNYFATSVQKLYKIVDGEWQKYQDKGIRLELGKTIYTKGIDKNGIETETASYTSVLPTDTIGKAAYDGDINTYYTLSSGNTYYMDVDSAMIGKTISLSYVGIPTAYGSKTSEFQWINSSNEVINTFSSISLDKNGASSVSKSGEFVIPEGTTKLQVKCLSTINIKEIQSLS